MSAARKLKRRRILAARRLRRTKARLRRLTMAERRRDEVTATRKAAYLLLRDRLPDDDPTVRHALRRYRDSRELSVKIDATQRVLRRRAHAKAEFLRRHPLPPADWDHDGLIEIDGVPVAAAVAKEVLRIRSFGVWEGRVVSGFRTPEHSEGICIDMCGQVTCPGMCAGRGTRHAQKGGRNGAVDLTDFIVFAEECRRHGSWLENHLPKDLVHFSDIGN